MWKNKIVLSLCMSLSSLSGFAGNCVSAPLSCPPLNLSQQPIILINKLAVPNIMFLLDDSSGMGRPLFSGVTDTKYAVSQNAIITIIKDYPNYRYGFEVVNGKMTNNHFVATNYFLPIPGFQFDDIAARNENVINHIKNISTYGGSVYSRAALMRVGKFYQGNLTPDSSNIMRVSIASGYPSPILSKCQNNYVVFLTGGPWASETNPPISISSLDPTLSSGDIDKDKKDFYMSDVARYYYVNNLYPRIQGNNVGNTYGKDAYNATWDQNLRFYALSIESPPTLKAEANGWPQETNLPNARTTQSSTMSVSSTTWTAYPANKIDDLWHAAFNTSGGFEYASSTSLVLSKLRLLFQDIAQHKYSESFGANYSGASATQNSTLLNTGATVYQASFNSKTWTGEVYAFPISETGVIASTPIWSASCMLDGGTCSKPSGKNNGKTYDNRVIISRDFCDNKGMAFRWPTGSFNRNCNNMVNFLANAPYSATTQKASEQTANDDYGKKLLNYIRGDATNEVKNRGGIFRTRTSKLGDIIDSSPIYVPAPYGNYSDQSESAKYSDFKNAYANRKPMLYVGANDGMLHGLDANTGDELLAYVPGDSQVYNNLGVLAAPSYSHNFFSNATPVSGDAFFKGSWHTILVSALGNGGKSVYALDITNPQWFSESKANTTYLFEFSNLNSDDVGYIQGTPIIAKVRKSASEHQWAIIFGNGYNSSTSTTGTGKAALYILFIEPAMTSSGVSWVADKSFIKISVGSGDRNNPNGLSTPYAYDKSGNGIIDYVYAGDLQGNLWRFDLTDASPVNWKSKASLLFTAHKTQSGDQPITAPPVVGPHPLGEGSGVMVYFGTGKFLEPSDNSTTKQTTQTFYGIWDKLNAASNFPMVDQKSLLVQKILGTQARTTGTYRLVSNAAIDWKTQLGWSLDLLDSSKTSNEGERQVSAPILHNGKIIFTTLIPPPSTDPAKANSCEISITGSSWLMELDAITGGAPTASTFDVNGDGKYGTNDMITVKSDSGYAAGSQSTVGISGPPAIFLSSDGKTETKVLSGTGLGTVQESPGTSPGSATSRGRRQNWIQVH